VRRVNEFVNGYQYEDFERILKPRRFASAGAVVT
jgi:hypothetical protein